MSDHVPQEVLTGIFLKLPVKSLLRFRSVSKSWYSLISDQNFISMHTKHAIETRIHNNKNNYMILRRYSRALKKEKFTIHLDDHDPDPDDHNNTDFFGTYQELDFPIQSKWDYFEIVGSCNGVICLTDNHSCILKRIVLWNASIGLSVTLPLYRISYNVCNAVLGFGFDSLNNNYKVIRIVYYCANEGSKLTPPEVEVFDLNKRVWRVNNSASIPAYAISKYSSQVVLSDAIHWVGYYTQNEVVIAVFDVQKEEFQEFQLPDEISSTSINLQNLSVMLCGELLGLIQYKKRRENMHYKSCCIWVMNEYGVQESWSKLLNVVVGGGLGKTLGLRNNFGVLMVGGDGELISYDPWSQRIRSLGIYGESCSFYADRYMESLVLLKGEKELLRE